MAMAMAMAMAVPDGGPTARGDLAVVQAGMSDKSP
jgi:hypothetical protein